MNIVVLGRGKTGSLVADVAHERGHVVRALGSRDNAGAQGLTRDALAGDDVIVDFTTPAAVLQNIEACAASGKNMVAGTTGWYAELDRVRQIVEAAGTGLLYGSNFSIGVNVLFDIVRVGAAALGYGYHGHIFERHHAQKKDAPSGTAIVLRDIIRNAAGADLEITSFREGDVVGMHELELDSPNDCLWLAHEAKSRRGFAEGAVRAAEWLKGRQGFFHFRDVWKEL
jgi:4-hydroxy-tetrahydrodipicolinate reductase